MSGDRDLVIEHSESVLRLNQGKQDVLLRIGYISEVVGSNGLLVVHMSNGHLYAFRPASPDAAYVHVCEIVFGIKIEVEPKTAPPAEEMTA